LSLVNGAATGRIEARQPIALADAFGTGDLYRRAIRNFERLEEPYYQPAGVYGAPNEGWPGDKEGRAILALTLLAQATGRQPHYLDALVTELPTHLNEKGYLGEVLPEGTGDEQYMAGHRWGLRGLCGTMLDIIERVVNGLFLPAKGIYETYPTTPEAHSGKGGVAGALTGELRGNWRISSDTGCAFIALDGVSQAYELLGTDALRPLFETMMGKFFEVDVAAVQFQTHATLTALRGLLRFYWLTGETEALDGARRIYGLYRRDAMTENYANYNWFGRPTWTEPCAMIDSFMVAVSLWQYTQEERYLDDAHHILYNAMGYGQRPNGGWGPDECVGAHDVYLRPTEHIFEAPFCCTMRGGEGLARAMSYGYFVEGDTVYIPFYNEGGARLRFADGEMVVEQRTTYPYGGSVRLDLLHAGVESAKRWMLYLPPWVPRRSVRATLSGKETALHEFGGFLGVDLKPETGGFVTLEFQVPLRLEPRLNPHNLPAHHTFRHGPLILGLDAKEGPVPIGHTDALSPIGQGRYKTQGVEGVLSPINDLVYKSMDDARRDKRQILFPDA